MFTNHWSVRGMRSGVDSKSNDLGLYRTLLETDIDPDRDLHPKSDWASSTSQPWFSGFILVFGCLWYTQQGFQILRIYLRRQVERPPKLHGTHPPVSPRALASKKIPRFLTTSHHKPTANTSEPRLCKEPGKHHGQQLLDKAANLFPALQTRRTNENFQS